MATQLLFNVLATFLLVTYIEATCPPGYSQYGTMCLQYCGNRKTFTEAQTKCANNGGKVVEPRDDDEVNAVSDFALERDHRRVWIGATTDWSTDSGTFKWSSDNSVVSFDNWKTDEPNNWGDSQENCLEMKIPLPGSYWNTIKCYQGRPYVCQHDVIVTTEGDETCPTDYTYNADVSMCYQYFSDWALYDTALARCAATGGKMAEPRNQAENQALMEIAEENGNRLLWLGAKATKHFEWISDSQGVTWSQWLPGGVVNPDVLNEEECVQLESRFGEKKWNDVNCDKRVLMGCVCQPL